jgi:hypothetical protein
VVQKVEVVEVEVVEVEVVEVEVLYVHHSYHYYRLVLLEGWIKAQNQIHHQDEEHDHDNNLPYFYPLYLHLNLF